MGAKLIATLIFSPTLFPAGIFACQVPVGSNIIEQSISRAYTFLAVSLICFIATVIFYSLKKNLEGLIFILVSGVTLFLAAAAINRSAGNCGIEAVQTSQIAVAITFVCLLAQFITWLMFRKKRHAELS